MPSLSSNQLDRPRVSRNALVNKILKRLSLEQKVGQLVMPAFRAVYLHKSSEEFQKIVHHVASNHVGGFILFAGDVYEAAVLINEIQSLSKYPLLIASDFERGANFRIRHTVSLPWNMAIGATGNPEWAYQQGRITGLEARALGVRWIFAPVLDTNNNPANPVINIRSYGEDPELVARMGASFIRGAQDVGVLATGKHFPGHGDTSTDSHLSMPTINAGRERLQNLELIPFKRAVENNVWSIMLGHVAVPALDSQPGIPATVSSRIVQDLLQRDIAFSRLVVTDSMSMAGLCNEFWLGDAAVRAINAGVDVLLDPPNPDVVCKALLKAVEDGELTEARIDTSVRKLLDAKSSLGLFRKRLIDLASVNQVIGDPALANIAQEMADASMALIQDREQLLPIDVRRVKSMHVVIALSRDSHEETAVFEQELKRRIEGVSFSKIFSGSTDLHFEDAFRKSKQADLVVAASFARLVTGSGSIGLPENVRDFLERLSRLQKPVVHIILGSPYILSALPSASTALCSFSNSDVSQIAVVKALFGEICIHGKSPVSLPGVASRGDGLSRDSLRMELSSFRPDDPLSEELNRSLEPIFEEEISKHSFPGASLVVGHRGLVFIKAYGRLSYSSEEAATPQTLYDLASLTKVISTTTLTMQLVEEGLLALNHRISRYFPVFAVDWHSRVTIQHLLAHCSGLPAHRPFFREVQDRQVLVRKILALSLESEPGTQEVYSDLGIILLGDIIEKVTGESFDQLTRKHILEPLQMSHTCFCPKRDLIESVAPTEDDPWRGRLIEGEVHDENAYAMGGVAPHSGLFGTSGDLAIFCQMLLNGGIYNHRRIIRRSTLEKFTKRQDLIPASSRALGWDTPSSGGSAGDLLSPNSYGHTGFTGTSMWVDPTRELFIVLLTNRVHPHRNNNSIREVRRLVANTAAVSVDRVAR